MSTGEPIGAMVSEAEMDPAILSRALTATADLVVLPLGYDDENTALYSEPSVMLVKQLRAEGVDAAFLDSSEARRFELKKGDLLAIAASFVIGVASTAAWDGLKSLIRSRAGRLRVTFVELRDGHKRRGQAWAVEGDADSVLKAIDKLRDDDATT